MDAVERSLEKIEKIDGSGYNLNSVLALSSDIKCFNLEGKLAGLPILIKDNIECIGLPASAGSLSLNSRTVEKDSTVAKRLKRAGAVIIGSTNLSEWANIRSTNSTSGWSALGGLTANPWIHKHSTGGSSSGSGAAVAAGLVSMAIGTETDGSIISPASLNGCVGIKPTVGLIPRDGIVPISASQDSPGPLTQTVAQAALLLEVITNTDGYLQATQENDKLRFGVVKQWITTDDATNTLFEQTIDQLRKANFSISEISLPDPTEQDSEDELTVLLHEFVEDLGQYLQDRAGVGVKSLQEVIEFNKQNAKLELNFFDQGLFDIAVASGGRNEKYKNARKQNLNWAVNKVLAPALSNVDVLLGATYAPAWESNLGGGDLYRSASWITMAPAISGWPIGSLPIGVVRGLPVGMGIVARANQEYKLISAMAAIEKTLGLGILKPTFSK